MGILSWIVIGLIVGWIASVIVKGSGSGILGDIILGIVGALVGGFIASAVFGVADPISGFNLTTFIIAIIGAIIVIAIVRALSRGRAVV